MRDLFFPATDGGALGQAIAVAVLWIVAVVVARRNREVVTFISGVAMVTFGWFGLRMIH